MGLPYYIIERAFIRVHILDPATLTNKFASTPCLFGRMATLGRETLQL